MCSYFQTSDYDGVLHPQEHGHQEMTSNNKICLIFDPHLTQKLILHKSRYIADMNKSRTFLFQSIIPPSTN